MTKSVVISVHNFTESEKDTISGTLNIQNSDTEFQSIFLLKHQVGMKGVVKKIFSYRRHKVVLSLLGENVYFLKSILYGLSLFTLSWNYKVIDNKGISYKRVYSLIYEASFALLGLIKNKYLAYSILNKIKSFQNKERNVRFKDFTAMEYLKTNLWFGTKAGGSIGHISGVVNSFGKKYKVNYHSCEEPIMLSSEINICNVDMSNIVYSIPYELNQLQIANNFYNHLKKQSSVEVVYQRLTIYNYAGALYCRENNIPFILEYNGSEVWIQENWSQGLKFPKIARQIEDFCLESADIIVTISNELEKDLVLKGIPKNKIVTYPNCIDPKKYDYSLVSKEERERIRHELGYSNEDIICTFIGTFGLWHGVIFLAKAIRKMVDNHNEEVNNLNIKFLLVGDGVFAEEVKSILSEDKYMKYVQFTGLVPQADAPKYLSISDVFLSPHTKREGEAFFGSPTKLFEYMAYKKPIIASNLYQLREVFQEPFICSDSSFDNLDNRVDGFLFEPNNENEFIQLILFVSSKYQNIDYIGRNARLNVLANYTWDKHVQKIIEKF